MKISAAEAISVAEKFLRGKGRNPGCLIDFRYVDYSIYSEIAPHLRDKRPVWVVEFQSLSLMEIDSIRLVVSVDAFTGVASTIATL